MGRPGPASQAKRSRDRMKQEHLQEKAAKREVRKEEQKKERDRLLSEGYDPDLAGIVAGPQPTDDE